MSSIENIMSAVKVYLERSNTPYAIMIDGDWGIGKTHLFKNEIVPHIGKKESIYISLFGLKTISDIENEIFRAISFVGDDEDGLFKGLLNSNSDLFDEVKLGGIGYAVQFGLKTWKSKKLNKSKSLVLCFDDFERWEGDLGVCISYINKLVEHDNGKCILIGSLKRLKAKKHKEFTHSTEKTIRHIYKLESKPSAVFDFAIKLVDFSNKKSKEFITQLITENKLKLTHLIEKADFRNIRVVSDSIQFLDYIYKQNCEKFENNRKLAISYYCCLLASLILLRKYILETEIQQKITSHGDKESFKLFKELGYFDDDSSTIINNTKVKFLLETIFYKDQEIYLEGIFSIITNGFYCCEDFEDNFSSWRKALAYEYYQDTLTFWSTDEEDAKEIFDKTLKQIFEEKIVTNPQRLLTLSDRITSDIKRGVFALDYDETKEKIINLFDELYDNNKMERVEGLGSFHYGSHNFEYSKDILQHVRERNKLYIESINLKKKSKFWYLIKSDPSSIDDMLSKYKNEPIFAISNDPEEIIDTLENLNNIQLLDFARWMGSRITNPNFTAVVNDEIESSKILAECILKKYSNVYTVRGGHFKQIARILLNRRTDYDPDFIDNSKKDNQ